MGFVRTIKSVIGCFWLGDSFHGTWACWSCGVSRLDQQQIMWQAHGTFGQEFVIRLDLVQKALVGLS